MGNQSVASSRVRSGIKTRVNRPKTKAGQAVRGRVAAKSAYHHGDLRAALLRASTRWIEAHGVESLSLREVARAAGVSPGAPYHHFSSKAQLLGAIAGEGFMTLTAEMRAAQSALSPRADAVDRLEALGHAYVRFALANPTAFRLMFRPTLVRRSDLPEACEPTAAFKLLTDAAMAVAREAPPLQAGQEALILAAWSLVHGASELLLEGIAQPAEGPTNESTGAAIVRLFTGLLRAPAVASRVRRTPGATSRKRRAS
jgi:AcrR family transcriptional regulator